MKNVCNTSIVKKAWNTGHDLSIHGWIYDINNGIFFFHKKLLQNPAPEWSETLVPIIEDFKDKFEKK